MAGHLIQSSQVRLRLLPSARCLFDEPVQVKVSRLKSRQVVAMRTWSTDDRGVIFRSTATYRADRSGEIDLVRDPSLGGSYVGLEPMGLLWSMRADTLHQRFSKTNSLKPHMVKFSVHEEEGEGRMLAEATNERLLIGGGVSRLPIKEGNIQGVLFTPPVGSKGIGVLSRSKAADIGLLLAAFVPGVEAIVWINGCNANMAFPLHYKKHQILSPILLDPSKRISTESGAVINKYAATNPLAEENIDSLIPIEKAKGSFLFAASEDDLNWDSKAYMDQMVARLKHYGKTNFESVSYPAAGHLLEPPYGPYCASSYNVFVDVPCMWGGEPRSHAAAEVHLWQKVQEFFRTQLSCDARQTKAKL
ncbi:acyl-coenzyme A thioesterase 3-like [Symphorus nematophorus]